jgi:hypothetical protein
METRIELKTGEDTHFFRKKNECDKMSNLYHITCMSIVIIWFPLQRQKKGEGRGRERGKK